MSHDSAIVQAAFTRLAAIANAPPIAWPGTNFTPPSSGIWFEALMFPNEPANLTLQGDVAEVLGFLQVTVCFRPGVGILQPMMTAEAVIAQFPAGLDLGPVKVRQRPWLAPTVTDNDYLFIPVTIPWRGIV